MSVRLLYARTCRVDTHLLLVLDTRGGGVPGRAIWPVFVCHAIGRSCAQFPTGRPVACCVWGLC